MSRFSIIVPHNFFIENPCLWKKGSFLRLVKNFLITVVFKITIIQAISSKQCCVCR